MSASLVWLDLLANNIIIFDFSLSFWRIQRFLMKVLFGWSMEVELQRKIISE